MTQFRSVLVLSVWHIAGMAAALLPLGAFAEPAPQSPSPGNVQVKAAASPGERVYIKWCAECHGSAIGPGSQVLEQRYKGQVPAILHERPNIPAEFVKHTVRHGMGFMSPFRKTEISDSELATLATYLSSVDRNSANKKTGSVK